MDFEGTNAKMHKYQGARNNCFIFHMIYKLILLRIISTREFLYEQSKLDSDLPAKLRENTSQEDLKIQKQQPKITYKSFLSRP